MPGTGFFGCRVLVVLEEKNILETESEKEINKKRLLRKSVQFFLINVWIFFWNRNAYNLFFGYAIGGISKVHAIGFIDRIQYLCTEAVFSAASFFNISEETKG